MPVTSTGKIYVGDSGTKLRLTVRDENGDIVDVSAATEILIFLTDPDGDVVEYTGAVDTDGTDGKIKMITDEDTLHEHGTWSIRGRVRLSPTQRWSVDKSFFTVFDD
jgi:hypothetical protein